MPYSLYSNLRALLVKNMAKFLVVITAILTGCVSMSANKQAYLISNPIETLASTVSVSVKTPRGGMSGNGYLVYQRPDRFRLVMLTPFGTPAMECFVDGTWLTFIIPAKAAVYAGEASELPAEAGILGWLMMKWVVDGDPLSSEQKLTVVERTEADGRTLRAFYDAKGLLERKISSNGEEVFYRGYRTIDGVPFPEVIEFTDSRGGQVKITFEEPDLNKPLEAGAFTPGIEGMTVLPLAAFKGQ